ncbi:hypothetical protein E9993_14880 [Labilibacter sediminis]|nr:hypothetical protein E9993_14880 [Labilibacter sediminis]
MKNLLLIITLGFLTSCTSTRYFLNDENQDKKYLVNYIKDLDGEITEKPLIIIDGFAYDYESLKVNKIPLSKDEIHKLDYLSKDSKGAINIYGERGKNGVVLILSKKSQERLQEKSAATLNNSKVLFLIGDKEISQEDLNRINPNDIESIEVIKEKESVSKFTSKDYDGVVIININSRISNAQLPTNRNSA